MQLLAESEAYIKFTFWPAPSLTQKLFDSCGLLEEAVMVLFLLGYTVAGVKQYNPRKEIVFISIYI